MGEKIKLADAEARINQEGRETEARHRRELYAQIFAMSCIGAVLAVCLGLMVWPGDDPVSRQGAITLAGMIISAVGGYVARGSK